MTRSAALTVATARYNEMTNDRINEMFKNGPAVDEASFGYKHGWVHVGEFSFSTDEMVGPCNQPYLD